jgi:glutamate formiminotransferase
LGVKAGLFEAVPNFSEGRDAALIRELAAGPEVLDAHADADHNRCVVTMAAADVGELVEAVFAKVALAVGRIDLRRHSGLHPRVGAADVVPVVPLGSAPMAAAVAAALALGERIWRELRVPVFFYAEAAGGRRLADIRAGRVRPDLGQAPHPSAGCVCVGARAPLVAYNVAVPGLDVAQGRPLVAELRKLPGVHALAFPLPEGGTQLSMNITRLDVLGVPEAYAAAERLAGRPGVPELVGLCPAAAAGPGCDGRILEARVAAIAAARLARAHGLKWLESEGRALAGLAAAPDALRAGAERVAALLQMLQKAGARVGPGCTAFLEFAAAGLQRAGQID